MMMLLALLFAYFFSVGCCCDPVAVPCAACNTDTTPIAVHVDFFNVENRDCSECGDFNTTTWILDQLIGTPCFFTYLSPLPCSGNNDSFCQLRYEIGGGVNQFHVIYLDGSGGCFINDTVIWSQAETFPRDCKATSYTGETIDDHAVTNKHCKWSTATTPATADFTMV